MRQDGAIRAALEAPNGARFYRCAFQLNPFEYLRRHNVPTKFSDEASYNAAIVQGCKELGIEVIAVMDHYRVRTAERLWEAANAAGLYVFRGFEAVTKDGVHLLCLFDEGRDVGYLGGILGACGIHGEATGSPVGKYDAEELARETREWGAVCIAAHVGGKGGLLATLKGQPAINAWRSPYLLACSLPGPVRDAPENLRPILENKNPDYRRDRIVAVVNAQDVNGPEDLAQGGASCWIKMSEVSVEGLRQAFLDPGSRIRLATDPAPEDHAEFVALAWQGGFLDGAGIHFNENLNVLIGGRGAGKSTAVESVRYVLGLEPLGEEARKAHDGIVRHVLRSGTKLSLLVRSHRPAKREYLIERTVPNPPVVRDEKGNVLPVTPLDVLPGVEVYGQHELSEVTKSPDKLTRLLERFVDRDPVLVRRKEELRRELERSRTRLIEVRREIAAIEERLASLPALEETLKRFEDAGLEARLKEQSLLVREDRLLKSASERLSPFREMIEQLRRELPIDRTFLSAKALDALPGRAVIAEASAVLKRLSQELEAFAAQMADALERADQELSGVRGRWDERRRSVQLNYEKILRDLQKSRVDGEEFIRLRQQIEELRPLKERQDNARRDVNELEDRRRNLLAEWDDTTAAEFRHVERAAKRVSRALADRVRVDVTFAGNREPLFQLLRAVPGRLSETIEVLRRQPELSLSELASAMRAGRDALAQRFSLPPAQADRLGQAPTELIMQVEALELSPTTRIELNVAGEGQPPVWQEIKDLSTGQKATAVLLLLLLESDAPLVVDQPEDDLDNRFITEGVVPKMRDEKRRRQFLFTTHNANIPVLGDAELIVGLTPAGEAGQGRASIAREHLGSIDAKPVRELVEEVLEGGKQAFEMRRLKYGF